MASGALAVVGLLGAWGLAAPAAASATNVARTDGPPLALTAQTPWVTPSAPWFNLTLSVGQSSIDVHDLHVTVTFYGRIEASSQLAQDLSSAPVRDELVRLSLPVTTTPLGRVAITCVTVLPDSSATVPPPAAGSVGACAAGAPTVVLGCTPGTGVCGDVYPVSVALQRTGHQSALNRFTTFMTYEEPGGVGTGGPLRVSWVVPISAPVGTSLAPPTAADRRRTESLAADLAASQGVPLTLAVSPLVTADLAARGGRAGQRALTQLTALTNGTGGDQLLPQPYVPINVAALSGAGLGDEITAQLARGSAVLRASGLHTTTGPWVDTASTFTSVVGPALLTGLRTAGARRLVVSDSDLADSGSDKLTFAQPFTLDLARGARVTAAAANGQVDSRFTADGGDPVLAANQLLATLNFIHFEDAFTLDPRGVVIVPPPSWQAESAFVTTLLNGLTGNLALSPVTLDQLFAQVPQGGNDEPTTRALQPGPPPSSAKVSPAIAARITTSRDHLNSFASAVTGHPAPLTALGDSLLSTEGRGFTPAQRAAALDTYTDNFTHLLNSISLAAERTITFTSRTAPIPITVLSTAPFPVTVVLSLDSDKFTFPTGSVRTLDLDRPTTPVRVQARARTSGDGLPVVVTLRTPDGQLTIAHTELTVHSTSISLVGIVLTGLAGLTLLVWWGRTWRKGRRRRPRAH
jgi:uncharacterized protein DUF6049